MPLTAAFAADAIAAAEAVAAAADLLSSLGLTSLQQH
jgi:hypothetical protein